MMNENWIILPVLIPLLAATIGFVFRGRPWIQKKIAGLALVANLLFVIYLLDYVSSGPIPVFSAGDWPIPYGIVFACDLLSAIMLVVSGTVALVVLVYSFQTIDRERERFNYYPFYLLMLMGINGSFLTGDIFNLYVFFEIFLISSYVLMSLGGEKAQLRETFKYMVINMISSALFLVGVALLYGVTGTLNLADLAVRVQAASDQGILTVIAMIFMVVFGTKAAVFPLYFWLPQSYPTTPPAVNAILGGLLSKVGVYALYRVFTLIFINDVSYTHGIITFVAGATMLMGVLGAVAQTDMRRVLSYHIISQIGYMIMGLGIFTPIGLAGGIFYIVHNIIVKTSLFLTAGATHELTGTTELHKLGGLLNLYPWLGVVVFLAGSAQAGAPPFSGFFSKFILIIGGLQAGNYLVVTVAVATSLLTLFSMMKIFRYAFWGNPQDWYQPQSYGKLIIPAAVLVVLSISLGIGAEWMYNLSLSAGKQLLDPNIYISAVLGA